MKGVDRDEDAEKLSEKECGGSRKERGDNLKQKQKKIKKRGGRRRKKGGEKRKEREETVTTALQIQAMEMRKLAFSSPLNLLRLLHRSVGCS